MKPTSKQDIRDQISKFFNFIKVDIWRIRLADLPFGKSFLIKQLRIIILAIRGYDEDKCFFRASSLTFYTLLSIVPVAAMFFGIAKGFGFEKVLEKRIYENFPGQQEVLSQVLNFSNSLLQETRGGLIAGIGLAVLFWSILKVLNHIERSFNDIWEIKVGRSWGRKFGDYLSIMLISPIFIILSGSVTVFITTQVEQITQRIALLGMFSPAISFLLKFIPYALIWALFTFLYIIMPNTKVNFKAGLLGGVVAGTIYQIAQWAYISFQVGAARYNAIYGSFAALPLFLMWVQISWWIVLFGAELSFANQNVDTYEYEPDCLKISPAFKRLLTLQIAHLLIKNFSNGKKPLTYSQISDHLSMPVRLVHNIIFDLVESGLVSETKTKSDKEFAYQPARDINKMTIQYVLEALDQKGTDDIPVAKTEDYRALSDALKNFSDTMEKSPANKLLKDI
ncbi:MAG: YihY/virulence factor BrkB family protein [Desulfobacterales bacterium]|nr:YihY/virulence factor BrkB family protein [Desulfobacterales bacterium]